MSEIQKEVVENTQIIEIIEPQKKYVDETEGKTPGEFEKIIEETENVDGVIITTKKIVSLSDEEIIALTIQKIKVKVALWKATAEEKETLKLLIW